MHVVCAFNRRFNYLRLALATLKEADRGRDVVKLHLYNDGEDEPLPAIVGEFKRLKYKNIHGAERGLREKFVHVINDVFKSTDAPWIFWLESDAVLHPLAIDVVYQMLEDLPDMGMGTIFNTPWMAEFPYNDRYVVKRDIGGFCTVIKREVWEEFGPKVTGCFGNNLSQKVHGSKKWKVFCTKRSYADHMGYEGMHKRDGARGDLNTVDRAIRFFND